MIALRNTRYATTTDFLTSAVHIAEHYGFVPYSEVSKQKQVVEFKPAPQFPTMKRDDRNMLAAAKKMLACAKPRSHTILAWRIAPRAGSVPAASLELHAVGPASPISEALLILAAGAITEDAGIKERLLAINSIGPADTSNRYLRDVGVFLRKHLDTISPALRPKAHTDPLGTLMQLVDRGHPASVRAPQPVEYLSDDDRKHLWSLLEFVEDSRITYELNPHILGNREYWSHTMFELLAVDPQTGTRAPLAFGGRYDTLARQLVKGKVSAAMCTITCESDEARIPDTIPHRTSTIYFAYVGAEARRKGLVVLDILRRASIPVYHGILHDKMCDQMNDAVKKNVRHVLVMGHKEAADNTVVIREIASNMQNTIPINELSSYLKRKRICRPVKSPAKTSLRALARA